MKTPPRRRFGQNFLQDESVIDQIIDAIDAQPQEHIVEIGPGRGALTEPLIQIGCRLDAIEFDRDLVALWQRQTTHDKFKIHQADALKFDFSSLADTQTMRLIGNLPYNISTPLLFRFLEFHQHFEDIHVMLQREVAERICATPGNKIYGRLSIMLAPYFECEPLFEVPPTAFLPQPKVTSTVIRIRVNQLSRFKVANHQLFAALVKQAFSQRRKTLRKSLKTMANKEHFERSEIDSSLRPEALSPQEFARLANQVSSDQN